ncbi:transporter [Brevibacillus reuszeri]|uniref:Transporter n=1 Tax=Brevibacillus reuszeri TaxID=54915 RepID=A0A0K9YV00_9BACL|nr:EamA family transporter [Brevibacillus reuszeri]KNB72528.1 transporter [Brevibacillus reuszeri]MED1860794.1 EamA family transporter [Brevibacillus reuszeri]GED70692.1 transporter [Brevibacillus reuszeri]
MVLFNYIIMCLIFGTTFLAIKVGIDAGAPPFFSAGIRFFLAGVILFVFMVWRGKASLSLLLKKEMFLTGFALTFGVFATLYWAEQYLSSGIAAVLSATAPLMILLLQTTITRKSLPAISWIGCLVGLAGVILMLLPGLTITFSSVWLMGCATVLFGQVFYSVGTVYSRSVIQRFQDSSPIALNAAQMIYGGALLLILSLFTENVHVQSMGTPSAIISLVYLIFVGSMMGHTIFYWLVAKTNPVFPATWLYISPLIALSLGVMFYHEPLSVMSLVGGITIIIGIVLINLSNLKQLLVKKQNVMGNVSHHR